MSKYDDLKNNMQALYDAAQAELVAIDNRREEILKDIATLSTLFNVKKTYSVADLATSQAARGRKRAAAKAAAKEATAKKTRAPKAAKPGRKPAAAKVAAKTADKKGAAPRAQRIKIEAIRERVLAYLKEAAPNSMAPAEILARLVKDGMPDTKSFQTRVYGKFKVWADEGIIVKVGRGVYKSVD